MLQSTIGHVVTISRRIVIAISVYSASDENFAAAADRLDIKLGTAVDFWDFVLLNGYYPNGWTRADGTEMVTYKLEFYDHIIKYSNELVAQWKNVILTWDLNIVHTEIDIARPKENQNSIWFLPIERAKVTELLENWYTDTFRHLYPEQIDTYSWWSYRAGARPRNVGWRIDYFVVNNSFLDKVEDIEYMTDTLWSDHCPVKLIFYVLFR